MIFSVNKIKFENKLTLKTYKIAQRLGVVIKIMVIKEITD